MPIARPLPATMRYIAAREPGPPDVLALAEGPVPAPKPDEVLIEVSHAGVNRPDCAQRAGTYPPPPDASPIIGLEVAGVVVACGGNVTSWHVGDAVCALTPGGGYAEYCATPAAFCLPIPKGLTPLEAASLPENFFTVWNNLFDRGRLKCGETVLIHGGSSGIGLTAIQLAKQIDATVFTTVGSDDKAAYLPLARRRSRDQLPDAGLRRRDRADHRQARRRHRARHGRRRLHREEPEVPRARGPARHHRLPARRPRRGRLAADHDEAPDRHRLDAAREPGRAQGGHRRVAARERLAAPREPRGEARRPPRVPAGRGRRARMR